MENVLPSEVDLQKIWPADPSPHQQNGAYGAHKWHSAQFRSTNMLQKEYWEALLGQRGFGIIQAPTP